MILKMRTLGYVDFQLQKLVAMMRDNNHHHHQPFRKMISNLKMGFIGKLYCWGMALDSCLDWVWVILCSQVGNQNGL